MGVGPPTKSTSTSWSWTASWRVSASSRS